MSNVNKRLLDALRLTVKPLIRLGDFVGNIDKGGASGQGEFDRCAIVLEVRRAIEEAEKQELLGANLRSKLLAAVTSCPHQIDGRKVVLEFSDSQPGANALAQLVDRLSAVAPSDLKEVSEAELLAEINRRGMLQPLYGAIGAMHDHLDRTGALDEKLTQYLAYRLRREEAAITGAPDSAARVANWQDCIDQIDQEHLAVIHSASESREQGEPVFWSNDLGWGDLSSATRFDEHDRSEFDLPMSCGSDAAWMTLSEALEIAGSSPVERPKA